MQSPLLAAVAGFLLVAGCQSTQPRADQADRGYPRTARIGCATCIFDMAGVTGCKLAVHIDGKDYLVEGSGIDDHGDAHAPDGLCNTSREAVVEGHVEGDRFIATRVELNR